MSYDFNHWKANDEDRIIRKHNNGDWVETYYGRPIDKYKMIQNKNNEVYLYNTDSQTYFKLSSRDISYGTSLSSRFKYLYDGSWINKNSTIVQSANNSESGTSSALSNRSTLLFNDPVQMMIESKKSTVKLFELISSAEIISENFEGPFGNKKVIYVDYTASGRSISFIEDLIKENVLPNYSNTHSDSNFTSEVISTYRKDARDTIKKSTNALDQLDSLVFVGSGSTAAVHKLVGILSINEPPIVIVSPYEHHSNLLPWREIGSEIMYANDGIKTSIDLVDLETKLKKFQNDKRLKIGSFTAASNVTGILLEVDKISILLHKYGFLSFWDYSTAAPHVKIDMNPNNDQLAYKDAVFFSGHKLIGGPQTPGVLIAKNVLFKNQVPINCAGGGTVFAVTKQKHIYINNNENREEGGTPAIVESIRLGLAFQLKNALNPLVVEQREQYYAKKGLEFLKKIPNLILLGSFVLKRLPIFSFLIKNEPTGFYLHYNFVTKLLNDLFGIQSRSGCACAGPYAEYLLGISEELAEKYLTSLSHQNEASARKDWESSKIEILKPGFTRFNLPFFFDESRVDYILEAIKFVCEHGWKFLPQYNFSVETGKFTHVLKNRQPNSAENSLNINTYLNSKAASEPKASIFLNPIEKEEAILTKCLEDAHKLSKSLEVFYGYIKGEFKDERPFFIEFKSIRWFLLPSEAFDIFQKCIIERSNCSVAKIQPPFVPITQFGHFDNTIKSYISKKRSKGCQLCELLIIDDMTRIKI